MTPLSPLHLHIDRRRMVILGAAGAFIGIAIVFGALAYFQASPTPGGGKHLSVPVTSTNTVTMSPTSVASSPASGETGLPVPVSPAVVTVTSTRIVSVPQASAGSSLAAIESGASTLATVVAAACAVIALRPQGRGGPSPPPAPATAPASTPSA